MALEVTDSNFKEKVLDSGKVALVDFWAAWCGPCKMLTPIIEELSKDFEGKAVIAKCDVDSNAGIAGEYGIRNIPTIIFLKDGEVVDKHVGVGTKDLLTQKLNALL